MVPAIDARRCAPFVTLIYDDNLQCLCASKSTKWTVLVQNVSVPCIYTGLVSGHHCACRCPSPGGHSTSCVTELKLYVFSKKLLWIEVIPGYIWLDDVIQNGRRDLGKSLGKHSADTEALLHILTLELLKGIARSRWPFWKMTSNLQNVISNYWWPETPRSDRVNAFVVGIVPTGGLGPFAAMSSVLAH